MPTTSSAADRRSAHLLATSNEPQLHPSTSAGEMSLVLSRNSSYSQFPAGTAAIIVDSSSQPGSRRMTGESGNAVAGLCLKDIAAAALHAAAATAASSSRRGSLIGGGGRPPPHHQTTTTTTLHQPPTLGGIVAQRRMLMGLLQHQQQQHQQQQHHNDASNTPAARSGRISRSGSFSSAVQFFKRRPHNAAGEEEAGDDDDSGGGGGDPQSRRRCTAANRSAGDENFTAVLAAFYAKLLVVLGVALPVTGVLAETQEASFYQGFYLYLYVVSVAFVVFMYVVHWRARAFDSMVDSIHDAADDRKPPKRVRAAVARRYGSFYLRIGAVAFGIGSMVYSGLEMGQYFELNKAGNGAGCRNVLLLVALTPAARTVLSIVQMQFVFLNTKAFEMQRHRVVARFGLAHMVATNVCEWLFVLVEETKHEIVNLEQDGLLHHTHASGPNDTTTRVECRRTTNIMGRLVQNASPFLFPCTIEYSLICAVILFEMLKHIRNDDADDDDGGDGPTSKSTETSRPRQRKISEAAASSAHHFSVDCSRAHRGLFAGILVIVLTIIALIMFFVLAAVPEQRANATLAVTWTEMALYVLTTAALALAYQRMRDLRFVRRRQKAGEGGGGIPLDCTLLLLAQSGCYIYGMFSMIGSYFVANRLADSDDSSGTTTVALITEACGLLQTSAQTIFILNAWHRRLADGDRRQAREMPGRETVTLLLVANMAMWCVNALVKTRAAFRPTHLRFFGAWAWTIITHVSMPLAIFYRFHSTICLFEIWKTTYKVRVAGGGGGGEAAAVDEALLVRKKNRRAEPNGKGTAGPGQTQMVDRRHSSRQQRHQPHDQLATADSHQGGQYEILLG